MHIYVYLYVYIYITHMHYMRCQHRWPQAVVLPGTCPPTSMGRGITDDLQ